MIAAEQWEAPVHEWTTDDLDALPEDGVRRELIDGVLIVSPAPSTPHQTLAGMLMATLVASCPKEYVVTQGVEVRVSSRRTFIPDLVVVDAFAASKYPQHYLPREVLLAGEIVSPSSRSFDRVLKPNLYAEAGITYYWRIELEPTLAIHTHKLADPHYRELGTFTRDLATDEPWPMVFSVPELLPDALRRNG